MNVRCAEEIPRERKSKEMKDHTIYGNHRAFSGRSDFGLSYGVLEVCDELIYEWQSEALLVTLVFSCSRVKVRGVMQSINDITKRKERKAFSGNGRIKGLSQIN